MPAGGLRLTRRPRPRTRQDPPQPFPTDCNLTQTGPSPPATSGPLAALPAVASPLTARHQWPSPAPDAPTVALLDALAGHLGQGGRREGAVAATWDAARCQWSSEASRVAPIASGGFLDATHGTGGPVVRDRPWVGVAPLRPRKAPSLAGQSPGGTGDSAVELPPLGIACALDQRAHKLAHRVGKMGRHVQEGNGLASGFGGAGYCTPCCTGFSAAL